MEQPQLINPLSFSGVYGTHSVLASMYQALFMKLFGINNFAWRFSNIVLIFPLSFFFYRWLKQSFSKEVAFLATILLQCSFYLANFFKIGYDNPQSLTLFIISLYLATRFGKAPSKKLGLCLGLTLGISFYIYFGPATPLFLWPYFLPLLKSIHKSKTRNALLVFICTYFILLFPLLFQIRSLENVYRALGSSSTFHLKNTILYDFLLFYRNNDYFYNHFVVGPYLDSISQVFCLIGTIIVVLRIKKIPYLLLLLSYISVVFFFGITSSFFSQTTRGIFFLPYGFTFAGIGLNLVKQSIEDKENAFIFCWIMILIIMILNVYRSQIGVFTNKKAGYTGISLIIRSLEQAKLEHKSVVFVISSSMYINRWTWALPIMVQAYNLNNVPYRIVSPNYFHCPTNSSNILFFQYDSTVIGQLSQLYCANSNYIMLSPNIALF